MRWLGLESQQDSATVFLLNADSIILDQFSYSDDLHFELINDPEGVSLERVLLNSINPFGYIFFTISILFWDYNKCLSI